MSLKTPSKKQMRELAIARFTFYSTLRISLAESGKTKKAVAEKMGMNLSTFSRTIRGKRDITPEETKKFAAAIGKSVSFLEAEVTRHKPDTVRLFKSMAAVQKSAKVVLAALRTELAQTPEAPV